MADLLVKIDGPRNSRVAIVRDDICCLFVIGMRIYHILGRVSNGQSRVFLTHIPSSMEMKLEVMLSPILFLS